MKTTMAKMKKAKKKAPSGKQTMDFANKKPVGNAAKPPARKLKLKK